ncbi:ribosomal protection-like ABC-F family protein [Pseudoneobacillus sp. C159]
MTVIRVKHIQKSFGEKEIFKDINFEIKANDRIGLVGYNGTGKTTLANIITGKLKADSGTVEFFQSVKMGYLSQTIDYETLDYQKGQYDGDNQEFYAVASHLGLRKVNQWTNKMYQHLSGGERLKLVLAQIWNHGPNLLILDEPTNHLDLQGINWLIEELKKFKGPVLVISHDRYFLDQTTSMIYELEDGNLFQYPGNYSNYQKEKERRKEIQLHQFLEQQKYKQKIEAQMERLNQWSEKAHRDSTKQGSPSERRQIGFKEYHRKKAKKMDQQISSKMKRLEKELDRNKLTKPKDEPELGFQFKLDGKRGKRVLECKNLEKSFDNHPLIQQSHFYIKHGEKVGIVGPNGCGKTTFIKMILGLEEPTVGEIWTGKTLRIAYLSQEILDLDPAKTVMETFGSLTRDQIQLVRTYIANIGLQRDISEKRIAALSLGQRIRIKLVDMLIKDYDILILDEPTNHLDLPSREQLENTLKDFTGTIITVSHDYYFINRICDTLLIFENKQIKRVEKTLNEYLNPENHDKENNQKNLDLMVIENRISQILGEISLLTPTDPAYQLLDSQFKDLLKAKKEFLT